MHYFNIQLLCSGLQKTDCHSLTLCVRRSIRARLLGVGVMIRFFAVSIFFSLVLFGCSGNQSGSTGPSPQNNNNSQPGSNSGGQDDQPTPKMQALKVYEGENSVLNTINAVNLNAGENVFEFTFQADRDEALVETYIKSIPVGCADSDVGIDLHLYRVGENGTVDTRYAGIPQGVSGVNVKQGHQYIAKMIFTLDKSCLGLSFQFGIQANQPVVSNVAESVPGDL
jgi:hypothetical protein